TFGRQDLWRSGGRCRQHHCQATRDQAQSRGKCLRREGPYLARQGGWPGKVSEKGRWKILCFHRTLRGLKLAQNEYEGPIFGAFFLLFTLEDDHTAPYIYPFAILECFWGWIDLEPELAPTGGYFPNIG